MLLIEWLRCHLFGRHKYRVEAETTKDKRIEFRMFCTSCDFDKIATLKLKPISEFMKQDRKFQHLTLIK